MFRDFDFLVLSILWCALAAFVPERARAIEPTGAESATTAAAGEDGILLLNDGGVLRGRIALEGDRYIVTGAKSRLEVPAKNVALASDSLTAAYEQQRQRLLHDTPEAHLALADWCLRYELLPQAGEELAVARRLDPHNSKLDLLRRRLEVATQSASPRKAVDVETDDGNQLSAAEVARLEAITAELPAGAMERFTRKVQPLLVNNCTTAGCHQMAGKQVFQLDRAVLHGLSNRRTTLSNLVATLALVRRDAPQLSPLLTIPRAEHAEMKQPILGSRQDQQFHQLEEWVALVTGTPVPEDDKSATAKTGADAAKRGTSAKRRSKATVSQTARSESKSLPPDEERTNGAADGVVQASYDEPLPFQQLRERKRAAVKLKSWEPKDAFDPEIFNRQSAHSNAGNESDRAAEAGPAQ